LCLFLNESRNKLYDIKRQSFFAHVLNVKKIITKNVYLLKNDVVEDVDRMKTREKRASTLSPATTIIEFRNDIFYILFCRN